MTTGQCERCEEVTELVITTMEQKFFGSELTHCQECSDALAEKAQERDHLSYWRG